MPQFSIIIPVYNTANYLNRCLGSIVQQTFSDFEVLLIDDGSVDDSLAICHEWEEKDSRIFVYHQENQGASAARNKGLQHATGRYIQFVDSDDAIESDCLESINTLIQAYNAPDIVEYRLKYIGPSGISNIQGTILPDGYYDRNYLVDIFLPVMLQTKRDDTIYYNIFNVLRFVKRDLISTHSIQFNEKIRRWEDWLFAMELFYRAQEMVVSSKALYHYYGHESGGLGGRYQPETYCYVIAAYQKLDNLLGDKYNTFSAYAVQQKLSQLERCIQEIWENENYRKRVQILQQLIYEDYFSHLICCSNRTSKICVIRPFIISHNYKMALFTLCIYIVFTRFVRKIRHSLGHIYHKYFIGA